MVLKETMSHIKGNLVSFKGNRITFKQGVYKKDGEDI